MKQIKFFPWRNFLAWAIFIFGVLICHYTGSKGIFPLDSFSHFDSGYRILNGEHPFRDYWIVSGFFVDYLQSVIFYTLGVNWQTYILNASLLNGAASVLIYNLFNSLGLNFKLSFFYAICFSILAYPTSGTPFVDHHSTFLSIISLVMLIKSMQSNKLHYWALVPVFLFAAFLSKQVPATYIFFITILLIILHLIFQEKKKIIKIFLILFLSSSILISLLLISFKLNNIELKNFLTQYILYPSTIGEGRFRTIEYDLKNTFFNFKFIYLALFFLVFFTFENLREKKFFYNYISFKVLLICILTFLALAHHIIFTKNQIFIFFLIPLILGFASIQLNLIHKNYKRFINILLIIFCLGVTYKYHIRYNEERKFHELNNVQFTNSIKATNLSDKFYGLKWLTPKIKNKKESVEEVNFLKYVIDILKSDKNNKLVLTNYSFFSVLTEKNISGYSRWYPGDNSAFPLKNAEYFSDYKNLILSNIQKKKIKTFYLLPDIKESNLLDYVDSKCFNRNEIKFKIIKFEVNDKCQDIIMWKKK